ncbi:lachesin-like [Tachypleus tridentatus]|uniref:lachesin-like n=1 Tax=Tachypleus tridentatus TaxID=6853 RepID=UPI003FD345BE
MAFFREVVDNTTGSCQHSDLSTEFKTPGCMPPTIQENGTSSDVIVNERSSVSLHCSATGYPKPKIFWRREDEKDINLGSFGTKSFSAAKVKGNFLNLTHITRTHMGAYLCIASNGIPPSVSKRIMLEVNFPPKIRVPNQVIGASPGSDVILECKVQAWPRPLTSWVRNENTLLLANSKYQLTEVYDSYNIDMKLKISNLQKEDFNAYKCGAKNAFGEKEGFIRLHPMATIQTPKKEEGRYIYNQPRSKELQGLINSSLSEKKNPNVPTTNSLTDKSHLSPSDRERKGSVEGASVEGFEKMNNDVGDKNLHQRSEYSNTSSITLVDRTSLVGLMWWIVYLWSLHL